MSAYMARRPSQREQRCDAIQAEFRAEQRRPALDPPRRAAARSALIPTDDELQLRLAEELEYARRMLDTMGDELSADMGVVMRHGVALQTVDIVGQMLGHIAAVIRSERPDRRGRADRHVRAEGPAHPTRRV